VIYGLLEALRLSIIGLDVGMDPIVYNLSIPQME
jgi:hypothetical protein